MTLKKTLITGVVALALVGCASTSTKTETMAKAEKPVAEKTVKQEAEKVVKKEVKKKEPKKAKKKEKKKSKKKGISQTVSSSISATHAAATAALKLHGFEIKDSTDTVISGKRPNKVGLAVGSGGEKMTVTLSPAPDSSTNVHVKTKKTFVGIAGQKNWDDEVMAAITSGL